MQIPFKQFEQYIDETILKRGLGYFKNGYVKSVEEIHPTKYEAIVEGTEDYIVHLQIQNENITEYSCTCPYDLGPVCKHVVAVIFYFQQEELNLQVQPNNKKSPRKIRKKKSVLEQVNELLQNISHDELKDFIRKSAEHNPPFRNIFLSSFAHRNESESKKLYESQIKSILRTAKGRHGFIDYSTARFVNAGVNPLLESAQKQFEIKNYRSTIFICCAVMEQLTDALQYSDDSNGDIAGPIDYCYELLHNLASENLSEEIRKELFDYCIGAYNKNIFSGWDWHLGMLTIASRVFKNEAEAEKLISLLDEQKPSEYQEEAANEIKLQIIRKTGGEIDAEKFLYDNLSNTSFRKQAIEKNISEQNFQKAKVLAEEGIVQDEEDKPGLVADWQDFLLKIALLQNDREKIIHYAYLLFVYGNRQKKGYFTLLKENVKEEDWKNFIEKVIGDLLEMKDYGTFDQIANIYISEHWWDRLLALIRQSKSSLNTIASYEKYLSALFPNEIAELYKNGVIEILRTKMGRDHYQEACKYMRRMLKLGAKDEVTQMVAQFRVQYAPRKALMEELAQI